ncbi:MAG: preprotein translocase subunit SecA [Erysipelotrichaceae bacterium]|nr:preprotein translocase subunit SecA [Erysipelotrichaceae bacterium]
MATFLDKLFNVDKRRLEEVRKKSLPVLDYEKTMEALSDDELKHKTVEFKQRLANGATLDDILPEAFATVREAARRCIGEFPYPVQIMGGVAMHQGDIAEMKTGEGKTLTSILPVYLNALTGEGVHVVTVNEYLAERDSEWMGGIHRFLGLTVGLNLRRMTPSEKRAAYLCDITYTTNSELGFDYLRDNMVTDKNQRVQRGLHMALVDEVDSILIDESRTPLIISGGEKQTANLYKQADSFAKRCKPFVCPAGEEEFYEEHPDQKNGDYEVDIKTKTVTLTELGVKNAERYFKVENLFDVEHTQLVHHINQALRANYTMSDNVEYMVKDNQVVIIDQNTGRLMEGRVFSDGLHQAIEAKENVSIKQETTTLATITYQNFFRLYDKLCGMTGTAKTEEEEFIDIYNMRVIEIPTNKPVAREDMPDAVYGTKAAKFEALVQEVMKCNKAGQPVLVGTISVETSEFLHKVFDQRRIKHEVLNAKNHEREAKIIEKAGRKGAVTIATNMAGRGTDIKLGEGVRELGGLCVLGSERHESRRIDNQLRGRSGRQGDPGRSQFFVSMEDDLMVRFGSDRLSGLFDQMGDQALESKTVTKSISSAQKRVEGHNYDIRKSLLDYDDVLRQQREIMYEQRNIVLDNDDVHTIVHEMFEREAVRLVRAYTSFETKNEEVDEEGLAKSLYKMGLLQSEVDAEDFQNKSVAEIEATVVDKMWTNYDEKVHEYMDQYGKIEKTMVLRSIDRNWINHIDQMDKLRNGIHLRSYAQENPLKAYVAEGYEMFEDMMGNISKDVVDFCMKVRIRVERVKR